MRPALTSAGFRCDLARKFAWIILAAAMGASGLLESFALRSFRSWAEIFFSSKALDNLLTWMFNFFCVSRGRPVFAILYAMICLPTKAWT